MKRITLWLTVPIALFALISACSSHKNPTSETVTCCTFSFVVPFNNQPGSYFPVGIFLPDEVREKGFVAWYSRSLQEMAEPSFESIVTAGVESYRFVWLRSFHPGVAVRVWKCSGGYCMTAKQLDSVDKYVDGKFLPSAKLAINTSRSLSAVEWNGFISLLDRAHFWSLPTVDGGPIANDGAAWLLEGARQSKYHLVDRQSPLTGDYFDACMFLLKLSGLKIDASKGELY
jgi:hypothetical protein